MTIKIDKAVQELAKKYGDGAIMRFGDGAVTQVDVIPSGSLALNKALGVNGYPRGRMVEIYGQESSGKTTLCLEAIKSAQIMGGVCAFIDMEHALDTTYAQELGVDVPKLYISQPDSGEEALDILERLVATGEFALIVLDSIAALVPRAELEGDMGDSHMGLQARLMSQALRKLSGIIRKSNTCVIFTNQLRMKIGVVFGDPRVTSGGNAMKYYASIRLEIARTKTLSHQGENIGNRTRVKVKKNKLAPPFKECEFDILWGGGISQEGEIIDLGELLGIIDKRGAYFRFNDELLGQGKENVRQRLLSDSELAQTLSSLIAEKL